MKQVTLMFHLHLHIIILSQRRKYIIAILIGIRRYSDKISLISLDEYVVNSGILISIDSIPTERNSSCSKMEMIHFI